MKGGGVALLVAYVDSVEDRILRDCRHAAEWVEANHQLFAAKVDLPYVLSIGEENQAEAALHYGRLWKEKVEDDEKESIMKPFMFTFYSTNDMWKFSEEIMDKRQNLAYCECHTDDVSYVQE
ncbi:unnamed protein product [Gadus morhua 'NCC']